MLASELGKAVISVSRPAFNKVAEEYTTSTQYGSGLHSGSTDLPHLYLKSCIDIAKHKNLSCAMLFVDVKTAFAGMLRQLVLPINADENDSEGVHRRRLREYGLNEEEIKQVFDIAKHSENNGDVSNICGTVYILRIFPKDTFLFLFKYAQTT